MMLTTLFAIIALTSTSFAENAEVTDLAVANEWPVGREPGASDGSAIPGPTASDTQLIHHFLLRSEKDRREERRLAAEDRRRADEERREDRRRAEEDRREDRRLLLERLHESPKSVPVGSWWGAFVPDLDAVNNATLLASFQRSSEYWLTMPSIPRAIGTILFYFYVSPGYAAVSCLFLSLALWYFARSEIAGVVLYPPTRIALFVSTVITRGLQRYLGRPTRGTNHDVNHHFEDRLVDKFLDGISRIVDRRHAPRADSTSRATNGTDGTAGDDAESAGAGTGGRARGGAGARNKRRGS